MESLQPQDFSRMTPAEIPLSIMLFPVEMLHGL